MLLPVIAVCEGSVSTITTFRFRTPRCLVVVVVVVSAAGSDDAGGSDWLFVFSVSSTHWMMCLVLSQLETYHVNVI